MITRFLAALAALLTAPMEPFRVAPRAASSRWHRFCAQGGGMALELLTGFVTAPSTTFTAWTLASGNSLTVRNAALTTKVRLLSAWGDWQTAGILRIRSPKLHDNVQGLRLQGVASEVYPLIPWLSKDQAQGLTPQDTLTVEQTGSATAGDIESGCLLLYYDDLPGQSAYLITPEELSKRAVNLVSVENTLALGTAGGYSGEEAINAEFDLLKANTDYALIGYNVSAECVCVRWRGADTGNLGVGGPGNDTNKDVTHDWFLKLSTLLGLPAIPVFNSANKAGFLLDGAQDENGTDVTLTSILVELSPKGGVR